MFFYLFGLSLPYGRVGLAFFMSASSHKKLNHRKRCFRLSVLIPKPDQRRKHQMTISRDVQLGCILRPPLFFLSRSSPPGWLRQTLTKTAPAVSFNQAESPSYAIRNSINFERYYRQLDNKKIFKKVIFLQINICLFVYVLV